jgi:hypothetical protein
MLSTRRDAPTTSAALASTVGSPRPLKQQRLEGVAADGGSTDSESNEQPAHAAHAVEPDQPSDNVAAPWDDDAVDVHSQPSEAHGDSAELGFEPWADSPAMKASLTIARPGCLRPSLPDGWDAELPPVDMATVADMSAYGASLDAAMEACRQRFHTGDKLGWATHLHHNKPPRQRAGELVLSDGDVDALTDAFSQKMSAAQVTTWTQRWLGGSVNLSTVQVRACFRTLLT